MTCIVGIAQGGRVFIGGDSAGVAGHDLRIRRDEKVFKNGDFVFGCTTSFRMIQLLRYTLKLPQRHPGMDVMEYMTTAFVNAVRECLKTGGFATKDKESEIGGTFLVGHGGRLFKIEDDYQVGECAEGYDACGCGQSYALASLYSTSQIKATVLDRMNCALNCAAHFSAGVVGPFIFQDGGAA